MTHYDHADHLDNAALQRIDARMRAAADPQWERHALGLPDAPDADAWAIEWGIRLAEIEQTTNKETDGAE